MQSSQSESIKKDGLYIHFEETYNNRKAGILNKIYGQLEAFNKFGYSFDIVSFTNKYTLCLNGKVVLKLPSRLLLFRYLIFSKIYSVIKKKKYSIIYIRYVGSDKPFLHFLKKLHQRKCITWIEFPTFPYEGELKPKNYLEKLVVKNDLKYREYLHKYINKAISFTYDGTILNIPTIKLENGVSFNQIPLIKKNAISDYLVLIGVANISVWHGYDRIIMGLKEYYNTNRTFKVYFKVVGEGGALSKLKELTETYNLSGYVDFYGSKKGDPLNKIFSEAHIAIGSLGMHRIGLEKGSILKLGEYLARGFATIIGYEDFSIKEPESFIMQVPPDETAVNIDDVVAFYRNQSLSQEAIRAFAQRRFSWEDKIKKILPPG